jgi:hypothetical protein
MKKFYYLSFALLAIVCFSMSGCLNKSKDVDVLPDSLNIDPRMDRNMERSAADTAAIMKICTDYLDLLKEGKIEDAVNTLYSYNDSANIVEQLTTEERSKVITMHKMFPVINYSLESVNLYSDDDTEFVFMVEFFEKPEDDPRPNTIREALSPVRVDGHWYLTIANQIKE